MGTAVPPPGDVAGASVLYGQAVEGEYAMVGGRGMAGSGGDGGGGLAGRGGRFSVFVHLGAAKFFAGPT